MHAELEAALAALAPRSGAPAGEPQALDGGITNRNFRMRLGGRDVVVRLPGKDTGLLGIDRAAEAAATAAAAARGRRARRSSPSCAEPPCLVTASSRAAPVEAAELREPPLLDEVAAALRAVHEGAAAAHALRLVRDRRGVPRHGRAARRADPGRLRRAAAPARARSSKC